MPTFATRSDSSSVKHDRSLFPALLIVAWLAYLGLETWTHAARSVQTPWGDAISYLQKAVAFWSAVQAGDWFNPFDLEPSVRPPGTILMSYPFGWPADFHGFYFRSMFLPIASTVAAVYLAAGRGLVRRSPWVVASIAALYSSLPMFYWFDWNELRWINNGFGMVDNFEAGIAALAAASMVRTLTDKSLRWQCASALLFCLTFTIKQSGLMLMGLMGLIAMAIVLVELRALRRARRSTRALTRYAIASSSLIVATFGTCVAMALLSNYLSSDNFNWAVRALGYYKSVTASASPVVFHLSLGEWVPLWLVATFVLALVSKTTRRAAPMATWLARGSVVVWVAGIWYWLVPQGGGIQVRYFYPFALMGLVLAVPLALELWSRAPRPVAKAGLALCFLPAINIGALLASGDAPSDHWQAYTGVSVSVGHGRDEVAEAYRFLAKVRDSGIDQEVYLFPTGTSSQYFTHVGVYEKIVAPRLPSFSPLNPMDWTRGFAVRTHELAGSAYVLNRKYSKEQARKLVAPATFDTFESEVSAFDAWISQLEPSAGFTIDVDGDRLRVLHITDADRFADAVEGFVAEHAWRPAFVAANVPGEPRWWNAQDVVASGRPIGADEIHFGGAFVVHALVIERRDDAIKIGAWWEPMNPVAAAGPRYLFLHLVDERGAIVKNQQIVLKPSQPPNPERPWRYGTVTFDHVPANSKMTALAFGVYQPAATDGGLLIADRGLRDWGGKRVLVPLP